MPGCTCGPTCTSQTQVTKGFRRALWVALVVNAVMFGVEIVGGLRAGSVSLLADAVDFAGDAANYAISLAVLSLGLAWRARAALVKGVSMAAYGVFVIGKSVWAVVAGIPPEPLTMGAVAVLAMLANIAVAWMLYAYREGDANMRSVWLCSRNDALGNLAVIFAAAGVFGTGQGWPDIVVAGVMAGLALSSGLAVIRLARKELASSQDGAPVQLQPVQRPEQG